MATPGGALVDITGQFMGLVASVIAVSYSGGSLGFPTRTFAVPPGSCTLTTPGAAIRCTSVPGVGANYSFVVAVDGGSSAPSQGPAGLLSYSPPIINSVDGAGAVGGPAAGGVAVNLRGVRDAQAAAPLWGAPWFATRSGLPCPRPNLGLRRAPCLA
jgi:hypothetical protein